MAAAVRNELLGRSARVLQIGRGKSGDISLRTIASQILGTSEADLNEEDVEGLYDVLTIREDPAQIFALIIDDAELLQADTLTYLRLLTIVADSMPQIVFVGRPEFWDAKNQAHADLKERITARWELGRLSPDEIREFIAQSEAISSHRTSAEFTADGLEALVQHSNGLCGRIVSLLSLVRDIQDERHDHPLTPAVIDEAAAKLDSGEPEHPEDALGQPALPLESLPEAEAVLDLTGYRVAADPPRRQRSLALAACAAAILVTIGAATYWQVLSRTQHTGSHAASANVGDTAPAPIQTAAVEVPAVDQVDVAAPDTPGGPAAPIEVLPAAAETLSRATVTEAALAAADDAVPQGSRGESAANAPTPPAPVTVTRTAGEANSHLPPAENPPSVLAASTIAPPAAPAPTGEAQPRLTATPEAEAASAKDRDGTSPPADPHGQPDAQSAHQLAPAAMEAAAFRAVAPRGTPLEASIATPAPPPKSASPATALLMSRGDAALALGDIAAARLFFERAASLGNARAATATGKTYDPAFLASIQASGITADLGVAASWYRKGAASGDSEAAESLSRLSPAR
jgi:hypothetical protein